MNLRGHAPRAALIRSHGFHETMLNCRIFDACLDAWKLIPFRLPYAEGTMGKQERRRAQWRLYNESPAGRYRDWTRNRTQSRADYMNARGLGRTATIRAERCDGGRAYQDLRGKWRV